MSRQIDSGTTKQIRIDTYWHGLLRIHAAKAGETIKQAVEEALAEWWDIEKENKEENE